MLYSYKNPFSLCKMSLSFKKNDWFGISFLTFIIFLQCIVGISIYLFFFFFIIIKGHVTIFTPSPSLYLSEFYNSARKIL